MGKGRTTLEVLTNNILQEVISTDLEPGTDDQIDSTNSAQNLPDSILYKDGDSSNNDPFNLAKEILITLESNAIRFTTGGATPTQDSGTGLGHILSSGEALKLTTWEEIRNFQFISKISGSHSTLQLSPKY